MRELKFRYRMKYRPWKSQEPRITTFYWTMGELEDGAPGIQGTRITILSRDQYIGVKDKNGKEIYEGDILTADGEYNDGYVKYHPPNGYILCNKDGYASDSDICYDPDDWSGCWVCGNLYENPELLEGK